MAGPKAKAIVYCRDIERLPDLVSGSAKTKYLEIWAQWLPERLRNIDGIYILEQSAPTLSNRLAMTVGINDKTGERMVASQILMPSSQAKWTESDFIKDLSKVLGTTVKNANRFLGEIGIATEYDEKTGYRVLAFIQGAWNTKSLRLGRYGTTTARTETEQDIATLDDLLEMAPTYRPLLDLVLNGTPAAPPQAPLPAKLDDNKQTPAGCAAKKASKRKRASAQESGMPEDSRAQKVQSPSSASPPSSLLSPPPPPPPPPSSSDDQILEDELWAPLPLSPPPAPYLDQPDDHIPELELVKSTFQLFES